MASLDTFSPPARLCQKYQLISGRGYTGEPDFLHFQLSHLHKSSCILPVVTQVSSHSCFCGFKHWRQLYSLRSGWTSIPIEVLDAIKTVNNLDTRHLATVTHYTLLITLTNPWFLCELLQLFIISSPTLPLVQGHTWLRLHNPHIDGSASSILCWSTFCHSHCLHSTTTPAKI